MTARTWKTWATRPQLRPDWEERLSAWLAATADRRHRFGHHDCLMQPAGAIEAQTGRDFGADHRGRYNGAAGAARYLRRLGFGSAEALLDSILDPIPPAFAQRGDIALLQVPQGEAVPGVVIGGEALFLIHGEPEPLRASRAAWAKAWSVGRRTVGAGE